MCKSESSLVRMGGIDQHASNAAIPITLYGDQHNIGCEVNNDSAACV
ncbi:hypothetical protein N9137_03285 [Pseudomonadales bacterium]|nr:hypothetical protein [Pseudomonadales bacterium]MDB4431387.1 hypothetical protein [Pseudomonadales bacterium]